MNREEITHLAGLARVAVTEEELTRLETELSSIVSYVSVISDIAANDEDATPVFGVRHNVFREDEITNDENEYTEALLTEAPAKEGRYMKVKKILNVEE